MLPTPVYYRPASVGEALALLAQTPSAVLLAGGTSLTPQLDSTAPAIIDLQAAGLDHLTPAENLLTLGAMVRLQTLADCPHAPDLLRQAARREGPNTLRHAATLGGTIIGADWESELLAALLACDAQVEIQTVNGAKTIPLSDFLANISSWLDGGLLTAVTVATTGLTAADRVARTPADKPIVAAVARRDDGGEIWLAISGVGPFPILLDPSELPYLTPPGDFRGSSEYRKEMANTLAERVLRQI